MENLTPEERIAQLEGQIKWMEKNAEADAKPRLNIKFGNKQNVVVGGPALGQRFPVTLYAPSWLILLDHKEEILEFIEANRDGLVWEK